MEYKILIVDDDASICEILSYNLINDGYETVIANSAEEAAKKLNSSFSLILLDVMMGGLSGYQFAQSLRSQGIQTPIIFLTAKNTENDMLTGFSVGADDYIAKPFSLKEISARVKAVLKRQKAETTPINKFSLNDLVIDFDRKEVFIGKESINVTKTEFEILVFLAKNHEKIFSRKELINTIWEETPFITERTVDVHITRLRKKLGQYAFLISNKSGYGYRFKVEN